MKASWTNTAIVGLAVVAVVAVLAPGSADAQDVLYVVNDKVGIGTGSPLKLFHVSGGDILLDNNRWFQVRTSTGGIASIFWLDGSNDVNFAAPTGRYFNLREGGTIRVTIYQGRMGIGVITPSHPLQLASGAYCSAGGVWTDASSRQYKDNVRELTTEEATSTLSELVPVTFNYKNDPADTSAGFIAEDVPELVATPDRKGVAPMDIVAVLTKVVQEQQKTIQELKAKVDALEQRH